MTNGSKYRLAIAAVLCCLFAVACKQERQECLTPKIASLTMRCIHKQTDTSTVFVDTALPAALLVALTDSGGRGILYPSQQSVFTISLSSIADTCKWGFTTDTTNGAEMDTLTFYYKRNQQFISNACGYSYFYTLTAVNTTKNVMIDSVHITNNSVTNDVSARHLQVFIHPAF